MNQNSHCTWLNKRGLATKGVQAQNRALNLPVVVWEDGKVIERPA
jgi:hypothetical protein